jgi:hypothetical protein
MKPALKLLCGLLIVMSLLPAALFAQEKSCEELERTAEEMGLPYADRINSLQQNGCLGGPNDPAELTEKVASRIPNLPESDLRATKTEKYAPTLEAIEFLMNDLAEKIGMQGDAGLSAMLGEFHQGLNMARRQIRGQSVDGKWSGAHKPKFWQFDRNTWRFGNVRDVDLKGWFDTACPDDPGGEGCREAYEGAKMVVRYGRLIERIMSYYVRPIIDAYAKDVAKRDRQWTLYFDEARFQYPWELWLNGKWMNVRDDRPKDEYGRRLGFRTPPRDQWIFLHPNAGLEYVDDAFDGTQFEEAVYIEFIGYNFWRWKGNGDMGTAMGVSFVGGYSDRVGTEDWALGLLLHYNHDISAGLMLHAGDVGILATADFAQYMLNVKEEVRKKMRFGFK